MAEESLTPAVRENTREIVREARAKVGELRSAEDLTPKQMNLVDTAYALLVDLEDLLVLADLKASVERLQDKADKLGTINANLKNSVGKLKKVAKDVGRAAKAVGVLVDLAAKASSAGIL
jgi:hypothetical protein